MSKLLGFVGATLGSYAGWFIGEPFGIFTALLVSFVGTGFGLYYGRKIGRRYE